jgi:hypothetical protein
MDLFKATSLWLFVGTVMHDVEECNGVEGGGGADRATYKGGAPNDL